MLPPAPAARVLAGRALATLSCLSAAALLLITVLAPPGGAGDVGRPVLEPVEPGVLVGELGRGEACTHLSISAGLFEVEVTDHHRE